jgi:hypothetical protein
MNTIQPTQQPEEKPYSVKLGICLDLLRKINWARRVGKTELADKLLSELHTVEGKS